MFQRSQITFDHIWIVLLLFLVWAFLCIAPLPPNDLWWHMAAGRTMVQEGALITTNRWAYTLPADTPYVYQSWLSELLMYGIWWLGNVPLLSLARTLAITLSYGLVAWHALRHTGNGKATALALLAAILMGIGNWTLRPQTLALPLGAAFLVILGEYLDRRISARWLYALPVLMLLWVNVHGSFALGLALIGLAWLGQSWAGLRGDSEARSQFRPLTIAAALTGLALFVNPLGFGIIGYLRSMLGNEALQTWFVEWQPPENSFGILSAGFWFYATLLGIALLMARSSTRPRAVDLLWYAGLAWLAIGGIRYVMWYGLLCMPLMATQLASVLPKPAKQVVAPGFVRLLGGLGLVAIVAFLPWFQPLRYISGETEQSAQAEYATLMSATTPLAASDWLAEHPIEGNFWVDMSYSSYTIWHIPALQVFADLRVELFPSDIWREYFAIGRGDAQSAVLLDKWQITHLMLDKINQTDLYAMLSAAPGWCEAYADERAVIMRQCP